MWNDLIDRQLVLERSGSWIRQGERERAARVVALASRSRRAGHGATATVVGCLRAAARAGR
jgi:hypothetical protein